MRMLQTGTAALFGLAALLVAGASEAGEITVMATVAVRPPYLELVPVFEQATGNKVATMWVGVSAQNERIKGGEIVDLVIGTASGIDELNKLGRLVSGVAMAKSGIGAAVVSGTPRPDISSAEALKRTLLASKSIALSATGPSGVYLSGLFQKWGIADELKPKIKRSPGQVADFLARGGAEIGFQQVSELIAIKGITYLGPLPSRHTAVHCLFRWRAQPSQEPGRRGRAPEVPHLAGGGRGNQEGRHGARLRLHGRSDDRFLALIAEYARRAGRADQPLKFTTIRVLTMAAGSHHRNGRCASP